MICEDKILVNDAPLCCELETGHDGMHEVHWQDGKICWSFEETRYTKHHDMIVQDKYVIRVERELGMKDPRKKLDLAFRMGYVALAIIVIVLAILAGGIWF